MSLYYEAAKLITTLSQSQDTSLKSLLFNRADGSEAARKSNPNQLYALITESWKWSTVLKDIIERTNLLSLERKLTPELALVLVHDLLLAKRGISAPESHVLRQAVERHKARLRAEFTKSRIRAGCVSVEDFKVKIEQSEQLHQTEPETDSLNGSKRYKHPRWLRINTLRATKDLLGRNELHEWTSVDTLDEILSIHPSRQSNSMFYHVDKHVPNLLAFPPGIDLTSISAYRQGELISQDKASCFPAYLLSSGSQLNGSILDACAAPGNKTSHIAAIASEQEHTNNDVMIPIYATERDSKRAEILKKMLSVAGAKRVEVHAGQDFFKLDTDSKPWNEISAIILDPSCSGSGIVDRGQIMTFDLPSATTQQPNNNDGQGRSKNKKRKRDLQATNNGVAAGAENEVLTGENDLELTKDNTKDLDARLKSLAALQTKMLTFAFSFPKVTKITYSTCSIHDIENEGVVIAALTSEIARARGWRVMRRAEQVEGLKSWNRRGNLEACISTATNTRLGPTDVHEIADACIRCEPFTAEGTQGFFVAGFVRDLGSDGTEAKCEEEWGGFDD